MSWRNTPAQWGGVSRLLHWIIAALMIYGSGLAIYIVNQEHGVEENIQRYLEWIPVHKSVGLTVFFLAVIRLWWTKHNVRPAHPASMTATQRRITHRVHQSFYCLMFLLPVSGLMSSSSVGATTEFWGWFELPNIFPERREVVELFDWLGMTMPAFVPEDLSWAMVLHRIHLVLGYSLVALVVMHIAAALYHQFKVGDDILLRMVTGRTAHRQMSAGHDPASQRNGSPES